MIQSVVDEDAYATLGDVTKNVAKTIKKSESQKQFDNIHVIYVIYAAHLARVAITRDKDLTDLNGIFKEKEKIGDFLLWMLAC